MTAIIVSVMSPITWSIDSAIVSDPVNSAAMSNIPDFSAVVDF